MLNWRHSELDWLIERKNYIPDEDGLYESLFVLSNGNVGVRATVDFESGGGNPGCFINDFYGNGLVVRKELINALNFTYWHLNIAGLPVYLTQVKILKFKHSLDLYRAARYLEILFEDSMGRQTEVLVYHCLPSPHDDLILMQFEITPINHNSSIYLISGVDWRTGNGYMGGTESSIKTHHLKIDSWAYGNDILEIYAKNKSDDNSQSIAMKHFSTCGKQSTLKTNHSFSVSIGFDAKKGEKNLVTGLAAFAVGKEKDELLKHCKLKLDEVERTPGGLQHLLEIHQKIWEKHWQESEVHIDGPYRDIQSVRFGIFHLLQAPRRGTEKTNIAARGLTSEYHSGHIFFNTEFYMLPYYCLFDPLVARQFIIHRIKTLGAAKEHARNTGFKGARYPEEADIEGKPAAPFKIKNFFSQDESIEWSGVEVMHLTADVIYAVAQYLHNTADHSIIDEEFVDFITECADFCADLLKYDEKVAAFGAKQVMCFDESHYHVDHHFATNYLCSWAIKWVDREIEKLLRHDYNFDTTRIKKYLDIKNIDKERRNAWLKIANSVYLPPINFDGVIPQFDGYFSLPDECIDKRIVNMLPEINSEALSRLEALNSFGTNLIKQADVIFLLSLFPEEFSMECVEANFKFYERRTLHASSLSMTPHASVAARLGEIDIAYKYIVTAMRYNLDFEPRENYRNGIHLGGYAGAVVGIVKDILGFKGHNDHISFSPRLPGNWKELSVSFYWRKYRIKVTVADYYLEIENLNEVEEELSVSVFSTLKILSKNNNVVRIIIPR